MFHINFKNRRLSCGVSQKQIADHLKITPQSVSKWEKGSALPSIDYLPKLAEYLNCDINAFFEAPPQKSIDNSLLIDFLQLMNDNIINDTKELEDIVAFEKAHPTIIQTTIAFCEDLTGCKTIQPKTLQKMLACSEAEARVILNHFVTGEMLEKLDIEDTYFVIKEAVEGFIVLLKFSKTVCEKYYSDDSFELFTAFKNNL